MSAYENECVAAGLDIKKVEALAKRLERAGLDAEKLGLFIFGGSGSGTLRFSRQDKAPLIIADWLGGNFDGGDGAEDEDDEGLAVGEYSG